MLALIPTRKRPAILVLSGVLLGANVRAQSPPAGFAVVELFTSEGCSSCPPADRLLAELSAWAAKNDQPVYALSFHVDYWDRLGWADPYASPEHSQRQRAYATTRSERSVYTPQMIVNGQRSFVGSKGKQAAAALSEALAAHPSAIVEIESATKTGETVAVHYQVTNAPAGSVLSLALVQPDGSQRVTRGENAGRQLVHVNIVRAFRQTPLDSKGTGTAKLARPAGYDGPLVTIAYLQESNTGRVLAAASAPSRELPGRPSWCEAGAAGFFSIELLRPRALRLRTPTSPSIVGRRMLRYLDRTAAGDRPAANAPKGNEGSRCRRSTRASPRPISRSTVTSTTTPRSRTCGSRPGT